jgi:hypothetical protein
MILAASAAARKYDAFEGEGQEDRDQFFLY